jgi:hypothetical protein
MKAPVVSSRSVNAALKKAGVPVTIYAHSGYRSLETVDPDGPEVDSIFVCYWHQMTLEQWVEAASYNYAKAMSR